MPDGVAVDGAGKAGARRLAMTVAVVAVTAITSVVALASPAVMHLFVRNLPRLRGGQWWRVATPMLVQPSGWGQLAFNLLGIGLVGAALQRRFGWGSWSCGVSAVLHRRSRFLSPTGAELVGSQDPAGLGSDARRAEADPGS
jgi:hypothetical protein